MCAAFCIGFASGFHWRKYSLATRLWRLCKESFGVHSMNVVDHGSLKAFARDQPCLLRERQRVRRVLKVWTVTIML